MCVWMFVMRACFCFNRHWSNREGSVWPVTQHGSFSALQHHVCVLCLVVVLLGTWDDLEANSPSTSRHQLSSKMLRKGSSLRDQLQQFSDGAELSCLRELNEQVARLSLIPVSERSIESSHAATSAQLRHAPGSSAALVSVHRRMPEIKAALCRSEDDFHRFAEFCTDVYHPLRAAKVLGLASHSSIVHAVGAQLLSGDLPLGSTHEHSVVVRDVVYRLDLRTQYRDLSDTALPSVPALPGLPSSSDQAQGWEQD